MTITFTFTNSFVFEQQIFCIKPRYFRQHFFFPSQSHAEIICFSYLRTISRLISSSFNYFLDCLRVTFYSNRNWGGDGKRKKKITVSCLKNTHTHTEDIFNFFFFFKFTQYIQNILNFELKEFWQHQ